MARTPDLSRRPALLEQTLDYLLDKSLADLTFRTLANGLGVSTYTLVYHFGTRAELIQAIVQAISSRVRLIQTRLTSDVVDLDYYIEGLVLSWEWTLQPRNRQLQRLEFEAGMLESLHPDELTATRSLYAHWQELGRAALVSFGVSEADARAESRLLVNTFHGIQYDLVLNDDEEQATASFRLAVEQHRSRVVSLIGDGVPV